MNVGFIGTGSMGSILIEAFIRSNALDPGQITAANRTRKKVDRLAEQNPGLRVAESNQDVASTCDIIFLCIKPMEFKTVLREIRPFIRPEQLIVSITSPVLIKHLEDQLNCKIAKVIPSITNHVLSGATLCVYGSRIQDEDIWWLEQKLSRFSTPIRVQEEYTRVTSDISSCGPAFLSFFIEQFVAAAVRETGISQEEATRLASEMVLGTGRLLTSGEFTPTSLRERVSVPGGITGEGVKILSEKLAGVFERLIQTTHQKYNEDVDKLETVFDSR